MTNFYEELFGYDVSEIYPNLYMGSVPSASEEKYKAFDIIIYCAKDIKPPINKFKDKVLLYIPLEDSDNLSQTLFNRAEQVARMAAKYFLDGKKILITCAAGINRSGLVTAFTLRFLTGWAGIKCVEEIKSKRVCSLLNTSFINYISQLLSITPMIK